MWIATRNRNALAFSQAGSPKQLSRAGLWTAALTEEEKLAYAINDADKSPDWDEEWGDRVTKLVFIGVDMNKERITHSLDQTLLTPDEMHQDWTELKDPFPKF